MPTIYTVQNFNDSDVQENKNEVRTHDFHSKNLKIK